MTMVREVMGLSISYSLTTACDRIWSECLWNYDINFLERISFHVMIGPVYYFQIISKDAELCFRRWHRHACTGADCLHIQPWLLPVFLEGEPMNNLMMKSRKEEPVSNLFEAHNLVKRYKGVWSCVKRILHLCHWNCMITIDNAWISC